MNEGMNRNKRMSRLTISKNNAEHVIGKRMNINEWKVIEELMLRATFDICADFRDLRKKGVFDDAIYSLSEIFKAEMDMEHATNKHEVAVNKINNLRRVN